MSRPDRTIILDARAMSRALQHMAVAVLELSHGTDDLVLIGIQRRGVELAERIAKSIEQDEGAVVPRGASTSPSTATTSKPWAPNPSLARPAFPGSWPASTS